MEVRRLSDDYDVIAPDGSEVRLLALGSSGSMAHFTLGAGEISAAKRHEMVEELWFFIHGRGQMCIGDEVVDVFTGISIRIPPQTRFQFRSSGPGPLSAVAVTMPPWPEDRVEAVDAPAYWSTDSQS